MTSRISAIESISAQIESTVIEMGYIQDMLVSGDESEALKAAALANYTTLVLQYSNLLDERTRILEQELDRRGTAAMISIVSNLFGKK